MADFITQVVMIGEDRSSSDVLDRAMGAYNFSRTFVSAKGIVYDLPEGTYFSQSFNMSASDVRNLAATAVHELGGRYDIVTVGGEIACFLHPSRRG